MIYNRRTPSAGPMYYADDSLEAELNMGRDIKIQTEGNDSSSVASYELVFKCSVYLLGTMIINNYLKMVCYMIYLGIFFRSWDKIMGPRHLNVLVLWRLLELLEAFSNILANDVFKDNYWRLNLEYNNICCIFRKVIFCMFSNIIHFKIILEHGRV